MNVADNYESETKRLLDEAKTDNFALEALLEKYEPLISYLVGDNEINGYQREDLMQESRAAFCAAAKNYDTASNVKFSTYAASCVNHRLSDLRKGTLAEKRKGNTYSLDDDDSLLERLASDELGPEEKAIENERTESIFEIIKSALTDFEYKVTLLFMEGYKYKDIAERLSKDYPDVTPKSVDNALTRVRKKLKELL